jgi:hypothetical protein
MSRAPPGRSGANRRAEQCKTTYAVLSFVTVPPRRPDPLALLPNDDAVKTTSARRRAPRRTGQRAQLTVPSQVWDEVVRIADAAGTTPNDVLVRLAAERLEDRRRSIELSGRADERWRKFIEASPTGEPSEAPLSEHELIELSGALRNDA